MRNIALAESVRLSMVGLPPINGPVDQEDEGWWLDMSWTSSTAEKEEEQIVTRMIEDRYLVRGLPWGW